MSYDKPIQIAPVAIVNTAFAIHGELKNAHRFAEQEVSLPIYPFMSDNDVGRRIVAACNSWARSQTSCTPS